MMQIIINLLIIAMVLLLIVIFWLIVTAYVLWQISERNKAIQDEMDAYHNTLVNTEEMYLRIVSRQSDDDDTWLSVN
jgi:heme/copper-type cytochrome/quinol oxidase subunit 2